MGVLQMNPHWRPHLEGQGLDCFPAFFNHAEGQIVGGHRTRDVSLVDLGGLRAYLKRQYRIAWKEYVESWWAGFGFVSKSGREWQVLHTLRRHGIDCPQPLAYGEHRGQAFLLVKELPDAVELGSHLAEQATELGERRKLARALGRACARLHRAGFTHPDLYAKHVYLRLGHRGVAFIDWQRTAQPAPNSWPRRWRDLAALNASLGEALAGNRDRMAFLLAYLEALEARPFRRMLRQALAGIAGESRRLLRRPRIRELRRRYEQTFRVESYRVSLADDQLAGNESALSSSPQGRW